MEVYKNETQEVLDRFLDHRLNIPDGIEALDAALARLILRMKVEQLPELRVVILANNARLMKEMERRVRVRETNRKPRAAAKKRETSTPAIH